MNDVKSNLHLVNR